MHRHLKRLLGALAALLVCGCASNVTMEHGAHGPYRYGGERYNNVAISWSENLAADADKVGRLQELRLDRAIVNHLLENRLYDRQSGASINVVVTDFRFRNSFNAIAFGFMSGADELDGLVTLMGADGRELARFNITASYALGGFAGGQTDNRLGWLSGKFAELAVNTIMNRHTN